MKKHIIILFLGMFCLPIFMTAQEADVADTASLEDSLFGGDEDTLVTEEQTRSNNPNAGLQFQADLNKAAAALESNKTRIGGGLASSLKLNYLWMDPYSKKADYKKAFLDADGTLKTHLDAHLFFDARPKENLKLYGKFLFGFPFEKQLSGTARVPGSLLPQTLQGKYNEGAPLDLSVNGSPNIKIQELYTDFSVRDIAFFRFGKHAVKWGTGYFYSPADVINLSRIDPQDPEAEREGPVSLRTHIVIPQTQHNVWLYLLPPMQKDGFKPEYTAAAAKAELLLGNWEWGIGGWYKYKTAPRLMTTLSGSIAGKVSVFAEGVFAWGSDYTYHKNDAAFTAYREKDKPFFQATAGASYFNADAHISLACQYFYNGFGYAHTEVAHNLMEQAQAAVQQKNFAHPAIAAAQDVTQMGHIGQHYIAFTVSQNKIGTEKVTASLFQQFAFSEREGLTNLTLQWSIHPSLSLSTGPSFIYPLSAASKSKGSIGFNVGCKLGGGKF